MIQYQDFSKVKKEDELYGGKRIKTESYDEDFEKQSDLQNQNNQKVLVQYFDDFESQQKIFKMPSYPTNNLKIVNNNQLYIQKQQQYNNAPNISSDRNFSGDPNNPISQNQTYQITSSQNQGNNLFQNSSVKNFDIRSQSQKSSPPFRQVALNNKNPIDQYDNFQKIKEEINEKINNININVEQNKNNMIQTQFPSLLNIQNSPKIQTPIIKIPRNQFDYNSQTNTSYNSQINTSQNHINFNLNYLNNKEQKENQTEVFQPNNQQQERNYITKDETQNNLKQDNINNLLNKIQKAQEQTQNQTQILKKLDISIEDIIDKYNKKVVSNPDNNINLKQVSSQNDNNITTIQQQQLQSQQNKQDSNQIQENNFMKKKSSIKIEKLQLKDDNLLYQNQGKFLNVMHIKKKSISSHSPQPDISTINNKAYYSNYQFAMADTSENSKQKLIQNLKQENNIYSQLTPGRLADQAIQKAEEIIKQSQKPLQQIKQQQQSSFQPFLQQNETIIANFNQNPELNQMISNNLSINGKQQKEQQSFSQNSVVQFKNNLINNYNGSNYNLLQKEQFKQIETVVPSIIPIQAGNSQENSINMAFEKEQFLKTIQEEYQQKVSFQNTNNPYNTNNNNTEARQQPTFTNNPNNQDKKTQSAIEIYLNNEQINNPQKYNIQNQNSSQIGEFNKIIKQKDDFQQNSSNNQNESLLDYKINYSINNKIYSSNSNSNNNPPNYISNELKQNKEIKQDFAQIKHQETETQTFNNIVNDFTQIVETIEQNNTLPSQVSQIQKQFVNYQKIDEKENSISNLAFNQLNLKHVSKTSDSNESYLTLDQIMDNINKIFSSEEIKQTKQKVEKDREINNKNLNIQKQNEDKYLIINQDNNKTSENINTTNENNINNYLLNNNNIKNNQQNNLQQNQYFQSIYKNPSGSEFPQEQINISKEQSRIQDQNDFDNKIKISGTNFTYQNNETPIQQQSNDQQQIQNKNNSFVEKNSNNYLEFETQRSVPHLNIPNNDNGQTMYTNIDLFKKEKSLNDIFNQRLSENNEKLSSLSLKKNILNENIQSSVLDNPVFQNYSHKNLQDELQNNNKNFEQNFAPFMRKNSFEDRDSKISQNVSQQYKEVNINDLSQFGQISNINFKSIVKKQFESPTQSSFSLIKDDFDYDKNNADSVLIEYLNKKEQNLEQFAKSAKSLYTNSHQVSMSQQQLQQIVQNIEPYNQLQGQQFFKIDLQQQFQQVAIQENKEQQQQQQKNKKNSEVIYLKRKDDQQLEELYTFGDIKMEKLVGKGKYSMVYTGKIKNSNEIFAIKIIKKADIHQYEMEELIDNEIKIQRMIDHQNIIQLLGVFDDNENVYTIQEYAPDGELYNFMKSQQNQKLNEQQTIFFLKQIIEALIYLHQQDIIHRDLKPENIMLNGDQIKLGDFGCSCICKNNNETLVCGTIDYVSPEMANREFYGKQVDIWSLGILTYEFLVGEAPFAKCKSKEDAYQNIKNVNIQFPNYLSQESISFMQKLLVKNPLSRMSLDQALNHQFIKKIV